MEVLIGVDPHKATNAYSPHDLEGVFSEVRI